jgi:hypothetical protein
MQTQKAEPSYTIYVDPKTGKIDCPLCGYTHENAPVCQMTWEN